MRYLSKLIKKNCNYSVPPENSTIMKGKGWKKKIVNLSIYNNPQMCYTKEKTGGEKYGSNRRIA